MMDLHLDINLATGFSSKSQIVRIVSENWVQKNGYCPQCGRLLKKFENNRPVADFFCDACKEEFELKSKQGKMTGHKIPDGAYNTMVKRITSNQNPHFFFLTYDPGNWKVTNFLIIPNFFFVPDVIQKRKPLSGNARRKGWVGCNIILPEIPEKAKIYYVKRSMVMPKSIVFENWRKIRFVQKKKAEKKGWIIEVMKLVDRIPSQEFRLSDLYAFEDFLKRKYPGNQNIKAKIRQQLQMMLDERLIEFTARGRYRKL